MTNSFVNKLNRNVLYVSIVVLIIILGTGLAVEELLSLLFPIVMLLFTSIATTLFAKYLMKNEFKEYKIVLLTASISVFVMTFFQAYLKQDAYLWKTHQSSTVLIEYPFSLALALALLSVGYLVFIRKIDDYDGETLIESVVNKDDISFEITDFLTQELKNLMFSDSVFDGKIDSDNIYETIEFNPDKTYFLIKYKGELVGYFSTIISSDGETIVDDYYVSRERYASFWVFILDKTFDKIIESKGNTLAKIKVKKYPKNTYTLIFNKYYPTYVREDEEIYALI